MIRKEAGLEDKRKVAKTKNKAGDIGEEEELYSFVSSDAFWKDFLDDKIDIEQFMQENLSA